MRISDWSSDVCSSDLWNWAPSRLFLGDVGSVPLGYLLGWLLLAAAAGGEWAAAVILPLYYLADASLTLVRRDWRRGKLRVSHRDQHGRAACRVRVGKEVGITDGADAVKKKNNR